MILNPFLCRRFPVCMLVANPQSWTGFLRRKERDFWDSFELKIDAKWHLKYEVWLLFQDDQSWFFNSLQFFFTKSLPPQYTPETTKNCCTHSHYKRFETSSKTRRFKHAVLKISRSRNLPHHCFSFSHRRRSTFLSLHRLLSASLYRRVESNP